MGEADLQVNGGESLSRGDKSVDQGDLGAVMVRGGHKWRGLGGLFRQNARMIRKV